MTAPAQLGEQVRTSIADDVCEQRLNKALDGLEKAEKALGFALNEIEARKRMDELKDRLIAVKDLIIAEQDRLIQKIRKPSSGFMGRLKSILRTVERLILVAAGVYVGGRL